MWSVRSEGRLGRRVGGMLGLLLVLAGSAAWGIVIDTPPPAFDDPPSPWQSLAGDAVITYTFKTSWDGIAWTAEQMDAARDGIQAVDAVLPLQSFQETGDFTLRWAGADFFKDWRDGGAYNHPGWDLTNPLAVSYKHDNGPWKGLKDGSGNERYPNNEIYFNTAYPWSYSLLGPEAGKYDFWTVLLHEVIHMLACDAHATHEDEVMYETISPGERKTLKESDLDILRTAGYTVVPEPASWLVVVVAMGLVVCGRRGSPARFGRG